VKETSSDLLSVNSTPPSPNSPASRRLNGGVAQRIETNENFQIIQNVNNSDLKEGESVSRTVDYVQRLKNSVAQIFFTRQFYYKRPVCKYSDAESLNGGFPPNYISKPMF